MSVPDAGEIRKDQISICDYRIFYARRTGIPEGRYGSDLGSYRQHNDMEFDHEILK